MPSRLIPLKYIVLLFTEKLTNMALLEPTERICLRCRAVYDMEADRGLLECRVHPLIIDTCSERYKCCGASPMQGDQKHYERTRPRGCLPTDHVHSEAEMKAFRKICYFVVTYEQYKKMEIGIQFPLGEEGRIAVITERHQLDKVLSWKRFMRCDISINLKEIHSRLRQQLHPTKPAGSYWHYGREVGSGRFDAGGGEFTPFCVVRRVAGEQDPVKLGEFNFTSLSKRNLYSV